MELQRLLCTLFELSYPGMKLYVRFDSDIIYMYMLYHAMSAISGHRARGRGDYKA